MSLKYILDRFIQYLLVEVLEAFITKTSNYLTKLVSFFRKRKSQTNKALPSHLDVLHQSEHFLVLNTPPDLLINSNDASKITVQTILRAQLPTLVNPSLTHDFYFAHRLDFSTSGILCIPLHRQACASLSKAFEQQKCQKFYIAVLNGHMKQPSCNVDLAIGEDTRFEKTSKKMCTAELTEFCKNPRKSHTRVALLAQGTYRSRPISKVLLQPITGRRHQLRLHCSAIGHPILGDFTYGSIEDKEMRRMYLHAIRITAPNDLEDLHIKTNDPFTGCELKFARELTPEDGVNALRNS